MDLFNESLIVPSNLRFFLHRLADDAQPSTNILKINAMNSTTASSGGLITVRLPMALVDLNSFAMFFQTTTTNGAFTNGGVAQAILPKGIEALISRMEVSVNGLGLLNLQQYNLLYDVLKNSHMDMDKSVMRRTLQNECDTAPLLALGSSASVPGAAATNAHPVFVSAAIFGIQASGTTLAITCNCGALYPHIQNGDLAGDIPFAALGITLSGAATSGVVSAVKQVPSYVQSVSVGGTTSYPAGGLVTQFVLTYTYATSIVTTTAYTAAAPATFTVMIGGNAGTSGTAAQVPLSGLVAQPSANLQAATYVSQTAPVPSTSTTSPYFLPNQNGYHCISDWLSFFKAQPNWIQLQMLGEVEIRLTLAGNDVLLTPPGLGLTSRPDYSMSNIFFTIRTCSFDNNFYDDILSEKLSSGGEVEIPYANYYNINQVQSSGSSSTRFSVNTQCLNKIVSVNRPTYYNSLAGAMIHAPCGYGIRADGSYGIIHKGAYFQTTSGLEPFTASIVSNPNTWQYQVNSQFIPNVKIDPSFAFYNHLEAWNLHNSWSDAVISGAPNIFLLSNYQMSIALDFMDSSIPRLCSGVDTRGAVSVAYLLQDDNNQGDRTDIFTCFTSVLKCGSNQQIQIIY